MIFQLKNNKFQIGNFVDQYADVFLHLADKKGNNSIVKANKVILAFHSKYFHRIFQSRESIKEVDMAFVGLHAASVLNAIQMLLGSDVEVSEKNCGAFISFLKLLEVDYECSVRDEEEVPTSQKSHNLKRMNENELSKEQDESEVNFVTDSDIDYQPKQSKSSKLYKPPQSTKPPISTTNESITQTNVSSSMSAVSPPLPSSSPTVLPIMSTARETLKTDVKNKEVISTTSEPFVGQTHCRYPKRSGSPANFDNWTETSDSVIQNKLKDIDFKLGLIPSGQHKEYVCVHCKQILRTLSSAEKHFIENHQKSEREIKLLREAIEYNTEACKNIDNLKMQIRAGCSKLLAVNQIWTIIENVKKHIATLETLDEKNLTETLKRKRRDFLVVLESTVSQLEEYIDSV